jgi:ABC-type branched-subunit amino acid transport system substrate-binding protein
MKNQYLLPLYVIASSLLFCACINKQENVSGKKTVKFGSVLALTGDAASYGEMMKNGMDIALEEINANDSIYFEIEYEDSEFKQTQAVSAAKKLIEIDKVNIITGITGSKNAKVICPIAIQNNVIIIDALSSAAELSKLGEGNYFRLMPSDNFAASEMYKWANELKHSRAYVFYSNDDWGRGIKNAIESSYEFSKKSLVGSDAINIGESNFRNILLKCKKSDPQIIYLVCYASEACKLVKQSKELEINVTFMGSDNLSAKEFVALGSSVVENVLFILPSDGEGKAYQDFREKYRKKYGVFPSINSMKAYDVVKLAGHVTSQFGTNSSILKQKLTNGLVNYYGVSGKIQFDKNGDIQNPVYEKMIYSSGKYVEYARR